MQVKKQFLTLLLIFLILPAALFSGERAWNCSLVTVGPGDPLYIWFGHTGLILENRETGRSYFYDFGNFSFESEHFYRNFAMGRLIYSAVGVSARAYMNYIVNENRDVTVQTLDLPEEAVAEMAAYLNWKVQPGNNTYLYHHYLDNCSTRIRDLIDLAVEGQLKEATDKPAGISFRGSFRRYSSHSWWADWLLSFLQGRTIDREITIWDTMFLPDELMKQVGHLMIATDGGTKPLVSKTEVLVKAEGRNPIPDSPPMNILQAILYGFMGGLLFLILQAAALSSGKVSGTVGRILLILLILVPSLTGCLLYFLTFFSNHLVAHENINTLLFHPFYLILPFLFSQKGIRKKGPVIFWRIQFLLFLLAAGIGRLPVFHQDNLRALFFFLPLLLLQLTVLPLFFRRKSTGEDRSSGLLNRASAMQPGRDGQDEP